jgi:hypothetical protein
MLAVVILFYCCPFHIDVAEHCLTPAISRRADNAATDKFSLTSKLNRGRLPGVVGRRGSVACDLFNSISEYLKTP